MLSVDDLYTLYLSCGNVQATITSTACYLQTHNLQTILGSCWRVCCTRFASRSMLLKGRRVRLGTVFIRMLKCRPVDRMVRSVGRMSSPGTVPGWCKVFEGKCRKSPGVGGSVRQERNKDTVTYWLPRYRRSRSGHRRTDGM